MIFGIDFDGTCCTHAFPNVGYNIGAAPVIKQLLENGHECFIWTMRGRGKETWDGKPLEQDSIQGVYTWLKNNELWIPVNEPIQEQSWTSSPKIFAHYYIDDMSLGAPLITVKGQSFINWYTICDLLLDYNIFSEIQLVTLKHQIFNELSKTMQVLVPRPNL